MFKCMAETEKQEHLKELWKRAYIKAKAGARILRFVNDLARRIYLYGVSKKLEEIIKEEKVSPYVILPQSRFRTYWNYVNILLLFYTATYMPYVISFIDNSSNTQTILNWIIDALFFTDIIVNFFSAIEESDGSLTHRFKDIAIKYLKSWFLLDLIAW